MFTWPAVRKTLPNSAAPALLDSIRTAYREFEDRFVYPMYEEFGHLWNIKSLPRLVERLAHVPWARDVVSEWSDKPDAFHMFDVQVANDQPTELQTIAHELASGPGAHVDHAIASGLYLFQYVSMWYWLVDRVKQLVGDAGRPMVDSWIAGLNYLPNNLRDILAPACRSCAYHNASTHPFRGPAAQLLQLDIDPVAYLSVLCDELQQWHRPAAGRGNQGTEYIHNSWRGDDLLLSVEEVISLEHWTTRVVASVSGRNEQVRAERAETLRRKYTEKLANWGEVLQVVPGDEA